MSLHINDLFYIQRPTSEGSPHFQMDGYQLREFVAQTQLDISDSYLQDFNDLQIKVSLNTGSILALEAEIDQLKIDLNSEADSRELADTALRNDLEIIQDKVERLEEFTSVQGFYYLQPVSDFSGNHMSEGGMAFNSHTDDQITGMKFKTTDNRGQVFTYININPGEKIEIIRYDDDRNIRKRMLFNIETIVKAPSASNAYLEVDVTYLFSSGDQDLSDLSANEDEFVVNIFPAFDPAGTIDASYVDNAIDTLDNKLQTNIDVVDAKAGVSQIEAGRNIQLDPSDGKGVVRISATAEPAQYDLPAATPSVLGGVKVTSLSGSIHPIIGINSSQKLTVQEATTTRPGVTYVGQCAVSTSNSAPRAEDYRSGTLVWNRTKSQLYIMT